MIPETDADVRIAILSPRGRDASVIDAVLARAQFDCEQVPSFDALTAVLRRGAGAAVVAEEALHEMDTDGLFDWLARQEPWSDFPFIVLTSKMGGGPNHLTQKKIVDLGNVILLERPLNAQTLLSAAASAIRARRRQYQARQALVDRTRAAEKLSDSQKDLLQLNETLESRINDRTRALAQANDRLTNEVIERERVQQTMIQFQKMEAVGRLTGGIAHDFNNLLNVMQNSLDLILLVSQDDDVNRRALVARRACERGAKLTGQLLTFSRTQNLILKPLHIADIFKGVRELIQASLGSAITVVFEPNDMTDCVLADENQIEMALLNLAINARDAMPHGGRIVFRADIATPPDGLLPAGRYVRIAVADNGEGMSQDTLSRVFEPFFTTKVVGKGTGLGLSQVYGMTQQSGGAASIASVKGVGTTVEIWLRLVSAEEAKAAKGSAAAPFRHAVSERILVVEDDEIVRQGMVDSLEALGYSVSQAADGAAGLRALANGRPSLLITDYLMPGMTGAELVKQAKQVFPDLPVIIATGYADMRAIDQVIGNDEVLRKPFKLAELAACVGRALLKRQVPAAAG